MRLSVAFLMVLGSVALAGEPIKVGDSAPRFEAQTQADVPFRLEDRIGKGWTVLFFYPKAGTPGCTAQACGFQDGIEEIRKKGGEVYGISADTTAEQAAFHEEHGLTFDLLADPELAVINQYGVKMAIMDVAKRWTFILDPQLVVRWIDQKVDPVLDAKKVSEKLSELQGG